MPKANKRLTDLVSILFEATIREQIRKNTKTTFE